jgi:pyruvate,orthophosphate dikinase
MTMIDELTILRLVAIKGRVSPEAIAVSLGADPADVDMQVDDYVKRGLCKSTPLGYRITPTGRERCMQLVAAERDSVDMSAVEQIYETFVEHNRELKAVITGWQMRGPDQPNDHTDGEYDGAVLERLQALHRQVLPLLDQVVDVAARLGHYRIRLVNAADAVAAGDHSFVSKPIVDSYHTVWFELHEDLIGLAGLTRAEEAEAGRGA